MRVGQAVARTLFACCVQQFLEARAFVHKPAHQGAGRNVEETRGVAQCRILPFRAFPLNVKDPVRGGLAPRAASARRMDGTWGDPAITGLGTVSTRLEDRVAPHGSRGVLTVATAGGWPGPEFDARSPVDRLVPHACLPDCGHARQQSTRSRPLRCAGRTWTMPPCLPVAHRREGHSGMSRSGKA